MTDFNANLSGPQGAGANPLAPVHEQVVPFQANPLLEGVVNIFAKGLIADNKQAMLDRKNAVISEYTKNEQTYSDALSSGTWNASMVATASRANYAKMISAYPEYMGDLKEARTEVYSGTEVGEAQKKVDQEVAFRQDMIKQAVGRGFTTYAGMSEDVQNKMIDASQAEIRVEKQTAQANAQAAEQRAQRADTRAEQTHGISIQQYIDKDNAVKGLLEIADKNFDALHSMGTDLFNNTSMPYEQKVLTFNNQVARVKSGLLAVSARNPELAAPWNKLADDISNTAQALMDPKNKSATELALLKNQYDSQMYKAKLMITGDSTTRNAVAISDLFSTNPALLGLANSPVLVGKLSQLGLGPDAKTPAPQVVGTPDEKAALKTIQGAMKTIQNGTAVGDKDKLNTEAVNSVNAVLKQNATMQGPISATMLKDLSAFYSSPEFGRLAEKGLLDMPTMQNAKQIFQVNYEPTVVDAVQSRINQTITRSPGRDQGNRGQPEKKIIDTVDIKFNGSGVAFVPKANYSDTFASASTKDSLREAETGLNTLIRMGAHMEGTTNYAKYWEENKHLYLPTVYPDPAKLKPGDIVKGYKYLGGAYGDRSNWQPVQ